MFLIDTERGVQAAMKGDNGRPEARVRRVREDLAAWAMAARWATGVYRSEPIEEILARFKAGVAAKLRESGVAPVAVQPNAPLGFAVTQGHAA